MVTITDYQLRKTDEGKQFYVLILQGGLEIVQSQNGGLYATAKKASMPSTFTEDACIDLIGKQFSGEIVKVECESYIYHLPETGEEIMLSHKYQYYPLEKEVNDTDKAILA